MSPDPSNSDSDSDSPLVESPTFVGGSSPEFAAMLARYGPEALDARGPATPDEAREHCARLTAAHYENFSVVTWLTPRRLRPAFQAVYAFCRWSDDLGDEVGDPARSLRLLQWWRDELRAMFQDPRSARHPVFVALREVVRDYDIPPQPFEDLLSAFRQDQEVREYDTDANLRDYCRRSADPVGRIVLHLARRATPENIPLSDNICTGLQLANFWQDVARDHAMGRVYLPREDRRRFGYSDDDLRARRFTPEFRALLERKVAEARQLLEAGAPLPARLPRPLDLDVELFRRGGLTILDRVAAQGYDVWSRRPTVDKRAKIGLLLRVALFPPRRRAPETT